MKKFKMKMIVVLILALGLCWYSYSSIPWETGYMIQKTSKLVPTWSNQLFVFNWGVVKSGDVFGIDYNYRVCKEIVDLWNQGKSSRLTGAQYRCIPVTKIFFD